MMKITSTLNWLDLLSNCKLSWYELCWILFIYFSVRPYLLTYCIFGICSQVLRQLAPNVSYRSLVMLGVASIQGLPVASFNKDDAERLLFFCTRQGKENCPNDPVFSGHPSWLMPPAPSRKRSEPCSRAKSINASSAEVEDIRRDRQKLNLAAMRPIPHSNRHKILPFSGLSEGERHDGEHGKSNQLLAPIKHNVGTHSVPHRKSVSNSFQAHQIISLNPLPMKKHGCDRAPIRVCSEVCILLLAFVTLIDIMPCLTLT